MVGLKKRRRQIWKVGQAGIVFGWRITMGGGGSSRQRKSCFVMPFIRCPGNWMDALDGNGTHDGGSSDMLKGIGRHQSGMQMFAGEEKDVARR